jgi:hypothetical protein
VTVLGFLVAAAALVAITAAATRAASRRSFELTYWSAVVVGSLGVLALFSYPVALGWCVVFVALHSVIRPQARR